MMARCCNELHITKLHRQQANNVNLDLQISPTAKLIMQHTYLAKTKTPQMNSGLNC